MADQRTKLAKYFNQRVWFSATFEKFTHKKIRAGGFSPVLLLVDLQLTDKKGKTVEPDIADHVWVAANKEVFKLGKELFDGDEIVFSAVVKTYGIKRNDVADKRANIAQKVDQTNHQIFQDYREDYLDWKDDWQQVASRNKELKQEFQQGKIDRKTMQQLEQENITQYKNSQPDGVAVKNRGEANQERADAQRKSLKFVDYQLEDLKDVRFLKQRRLHRGWVRKQISVKDQTNTKYTKYLAARSFAYHDGISFDQFENNK